MWTGAAGAAAAVSSAPAPYSPWSSCLAACAARGSGQVGGAAQRCSCALSHSTHACNTTSPAQRRSQVLRGQPSPVLTGGTGAPPCEARLAGRRQSTRRPPTSVARGPGAARAPSRRVACGWGRRQAGRCSRRPCCCPRWEHAPAWPQHLAFEFFSSLCCLYHLHMTPAYLAGGGTGQHDRIIMDCMHSNELVLLSRPVVCNMA